MRGVSDVSRLAKPNETTLELDSHADTCVVGKLALILKDYR